MHGPVPVRCREREGATAAGAAWPDGGRAEGARARAQRRSRAWESPLFLPPLRPPRGRTIRTGLGGTRPLACRPRLCRGRSPRCRPRAAAAESCPCTAARFRALPRRRCGSRPWPLQARRRAFRHAACGAAPALFAPPMPAHARPLGSGSPSWARLFGLPPQLFAILGKSCGICRRLGARAAISYGQPRPFGQPIGLGRTRKSRRRAPPVRV